MANKIPLKATYSGSNTSGLAEFQSGDTIDASFISGGLAPLASPAFTGTPTAPTAAVTTNTTQLATTAFVRGEVTALVASAPGTLDTLNELAAALGDDANFSTTVTSSIATKSPIASPSFTGNIAVTGTVDGVDIAARDAVLTSTTTTANAALPKAGGTMTGNVNLGDNNKVQLGASQDLQIYHSGTQSFIKEGGTGSLNIQATNLALTDYAGNWYIDCQSGSYVKLYHNATSRLETTSSGVSVTGNIAVTGTVDGRDVASDGTKLDGIASGANNYTLPTSLNTAGITDIGYDAGDYIKFDNSVIDFYCNNAHRARLANNGDFHADGDVIAYSTTVPSDERLKENIQPIEDALSKVNQLNGVTFTYIADGRESAGLIAQEVEKVLPSAVSEKELPLKIDDGKEYKVLQYDQTIGLLVEAVKELSARVEELESK